MSTKNRTRRTTTRNIRFPNQMIEQINIALEQKGSGISQPGVIEACRRRPSEKRAYASIKVMKNEHPAFFLRTGRYCKFANYEGIAVIELQFYHFPDSDRLRVGSVTD